MRLPLYAKVLVILVVAHVLVGCASDPQPLQLEQQVVTKTEYIVRIPPKELMTLPPRPADINPDTADQATVAQWLISKEQYTVQLENMLKGIAGFFKQSQDQADSAANQQNIQAKALADKAQSQEAVDAAKKTVDLNAVLDPGVAPK